MDTLSPDDRSWNCLLKLKGCVHTCRKALFNVQFLVFHAKYTTQLGILATFNCILFQNADDREKEMAEYMMQFVAPGK